MADSKIYTSKQFADKLGIEQTVAYELLRGLVGMGFVKNIGPAPKDPNVKTKGKGESRYEFEPGAFTNISNALAKAL